MSDDQNLCDRSTSLSKKQQGKVAKKVKRDRSTVSRYVHEFEAAVGAVSVVMEAK